MNLSEIQKNALSFMMEILVRDTKREGKAFELSSDEQELLKNNNFHLMKNGGNMIIDFVIGAIMDYHIQLRERLLEEGIDIGEIELN